MQFLDARNQIRDENNIVLSTKVSCLFRSDRKDQNGAMDAWIAMECFGCFKDMDALLIGY